MKRYQKRRHKLIASLAAIITIFVVIAAMIITSITPTAAQTVADADTRDSYKSSLAENSSTRYDGRIWTDKSVSNEDIKFQGDAGSDITIENDSDFLVTYSALATTTQITGKTNAPLDVVFIVDDSSSMNNSGYLDNTIEAVNQSIATLMELNPHNRVAVVLYGSSSEILLPLGHYTPARGKDTYISYTSNGRYFYNTVEEDVSYNNPKWNSGYLDMTNSRGTNIHMGVYEGMNLLTSSETTVELEDGTTVNRVPAVVMLSDGSPTYSSSADNWWQPDNSKRQGPGNGAYYGNGMLAMATAQYMKQQITNRYADGNSESAYAAKVYTIGMGINSTSGNENKLAYLTLDPSSEENWGRNNSMAENIQEKFDSYKKGDNISIQVNRRSYYTMEHPSNNDITTLKYNDGYYDANGAGDINKVFEEIVSNIALSTPQIPTKVEGNDPAQSGYITYTDPIGEYMEVKNIKELIYSGVEFKNASVSTETKNDGNKVTTYTFTGEIDSAVYGKRNASDILITVTETQKGQQTLQVKIPASAIPLRVNTISIDEQDVVTNTNNGAYPLRLIYSVGLKNTVDRDTLEGVSDQYIQTNTVDGNVNFYSNLYTEKKIDGTTVGDATVSFTPADTNPFYFIQEDTPLYVDDNGATAAAGTFDKNKTYYFPIEYYEGNTLQKKYIERSGELLDGYVANDNEGKLYIQAGAPRLGNLKEFVETKGNNTATANASYYPTFEGEDAHNGKFVIYLGNNGRLQLDKPASLLIEKKVTANEGLTAPDKEFAFDIVIPSKAGKTVTSVLSENGKQDQEIQLSFDNTGKVQVQLTANQKLEIPGMANTEYTVQEVNVPKGFHTSATATAGSYDTEDKKMSGTVSTEDVTVTYTNHYSVTPVSSTELTLPLSGEKKIEGRSFKDGDSFTFTIDAAQATPNAPLPVKGDEIVNSVTIQPKADNTASFSFDGEITFNKPGEYRYIIQEQKDSISGIDYDTAIYRVNIIVVDDGEGALRLATSDEIEDMETIGNLNYTGNPFIQKYTGSEMQNAEKIVFVNTYDAEQAVIAIKGKKELKSINSDKKLQDGQFTFTIKAAGSKKTGTDDAFVEDLTQPMPEKNTSQNIANGDVTFAGLTFTQDMIGKTYRYEISEVLPEGVTAQAPTKDGMTYDTVSYYVDVEVTSSSEGGEHVVAAVIKDEEAAPDFIFKNTYQPTDITIGDDTTAGITVQKTFTGHAWTDQYEFAYHIKALLAPQGVEAPLPASTSLKLSNPQNGERNSAAFGEMSFVKEGTYVYEISEVLPEGIASPSAVKEGITYDTHKAVVTVTVTDVDGKLKATISYDNTTAVNETDKKITDRAAFTNTYKAVFDNDTTVELSGKKILKVNGNSDKVLKDGDFFLMVTAIDNAPLGNSSSIIRIPDGTKASEDKIYSSEVSILKDIRYEKAGTYRYIIQEQIGNDKAITYDRSAYQATVKVTDDGKGILRAELTGIEKGSWNAEQQQFTKAEDSGIKEAVVFTNTYTPASATYQPMLLNKKLTGRAQALKNGEFSFEMRVAQAEPQDGITLPAQTIVANKEDGSVQFDTISFHKAGTYVVEVREVIPEENDRVSGVEYDEHVVRSTFKVRDSNGSLVCERTNSTGNTTFTNTYNANGKLSGSQALKVEKKIDGRDWLETDSFGFTLGIDESDTATRNALEAGAIILPEETTININNDSPSAENDASIRIGSFGDITFTKAGTYHFLIKENASSIGGIINDKDAERKIIVNVTDNNDGTLTAELLQDSNSLYYINKYQLTGSAEYSIQGTKDFSGRENDEWLDSDSFAFRIEAADDETKHMVENGKITFDAVEKTVTSENHSFAFDVSFHQISGAYSFKITEVIPSDEDKIAGVTYDSKEVVVTVTVTDNKDGTITAANATGVQGALTFKNTYKEKPTASSPLKISKMLSGRDMKKGEFTFLLIPQDEDAPLPAVTQLHNEAAKADELTELSFGEITFEEPGIYTYLVKEQIPQEAVEDTFYGVHYDTREYLVTYEVGAGNDGTFQIKQDITLNGEPKEHIVFENTYQAEPVIVGPSTSGGLTAVKQVIAEDEDMPYTMQGNEFVFKIAAAGSTPNAPLPKETEVRNDANGNISFGDIEFTQPGEYEYVISEVANQVAGISYDGTLFHASIVISEDTETGKLSAGEWTIDGAEQIVFHNSYLPNEVSASLNGIKTLGGRTMADGEFTFRMSAYDEATKTALRNKEIEFRDKTEELIAVNTGKGTFSFGEKAVTFYKTGTYTFLIAENKGIDQNITYDTTTYQVQAIVTNENGMLAVEWKNADHLEFNNVYAPFTGTITLDASKILNGRDLRAEEFEFQITDENGDAIATAVNDADGTITFDAISFTTAGTYHFTINEVDNGVKGITYDAQRYHVTVVVEDLNGQLSATTISAVNDKGETVDEILFTNDYHAEAASVTLGATKKLDGRALQAKEFTFVLKDEQGNALQTAANDENGFIVFDSITYEKEGTYRYTMAEVKGDDVNIAYDEHTYNIVVNVTDDGAGNLQTSVQYENEKQPVFQNVYKKPKDTGLDEEKPAEEKPQGNDSEKQTDNVATGDASNAHIWFGCLMAGVLSAAIVYVERLRRRIK